MFSNFEWCGGWNNGAVGGLSNHVYLGGKSSQYQFAFLPYGKKKSYSMKAFG